MYEAIDILILKAIENGYKPLYHRPVVLEAARLALLTSRDEWRIIDGRLQALRKQGRIAYQAKGQATGKAGWRMVNQRPGSTP
ncbi:hypothetical protein [Hydrogenophaga sp. NFH-34]|uniref:hypothetical protein n=1 Tax=Hydrogenophaga sp. NFH-34 TaxID=2744446 RepID=UPI001F3693F7|nr:hypothetical protein [Hydrogenophaga sp. NFH-34]